jgi:hypothetical protein
VTLIADFDPILLPSFAEIRASSQTNEVAKVKKANLTQGSDGETTLTGSHDTALKPSVIKVGPEGYIHGWIKVGPGDVDGDTAASVLQQALKSEPPAGHTASVTGSPVKNAEAHKSMVAQRIAAEVTSDHEKMIAAAFAGENMKNFDDDWVAIAHQPEAYVHAKSASGSVKIYAVADPRKPTEAEPVTPAWLKQIAASRMVHIWSLSSNDSVETALAMQEAAKREFNVDNAMSWDMTPRVSKKVVKILAQHGGVYQDFLRAQYNITQQDLASRGITKVSLARGMKWSNVDAAPAWAKDIITSKKADSVEVKLPQVRPLSSWSLQEITAYQFSGRNGVVLKADIPASKVLSWPKSGFGALDEAELVTLPHDGVGMISRGGQ